MTGRFDYFVIFAGMRTGSNYLERNLNAAPDVRCFGELFNPYFIAHEGEESYLGLTLAERESDPDALVRRIQAEATGLAGFRLFHDHDPRVRAQALADPCAGKIILTRNPLESFVSYQRALASNQWVLTDAKGQVETDAIAFDGAAFEAFLGPQAAFLSDIRNGLAKAGQTALSLRYEDLQDLEVINGVLSYLGSRHTLPRLERSLKRQNPEPLETKVTNMPALRAAVADLDPFGLDHESPQPLDRGPAVRSYVACPSTGLLYLPMEGPQPDPILGWMAALDGCAPEELITGMRQKDLRVWRAAHPGSRTFTVVRHPLARAYTAFTTRILPSDLQSFADLRHGLVAAYKVPLPQTYPSEVVTRAERQKAFRGFLKFLKPNLAAQTSLRTDASWMAQVTVLQGMAQVAIPDRILRDGPGLAGGLRALAADLGRPAVDHALQYDTGDLADLHGPDLDRLARTAYARDFATFGFKDWAD